MSKFDTIKRNAAESIGKAATGPRLAVPSAPAAPATVATADHVRRLKQSASVLRDVPLDLVESDPDQPRKTFDAAEMYELSESLGKNGQLQPCEVYEVGGKYRIVFGERRYRAAQGAKLATLACVILPSKPVDSTLRVRQLVENLQRVDVPPVEQAEAFLAVMHENGWTAKRLADELGVSTGFIAKSVALVRLPEELQLRIRDGQLTKSLGYALSQYPADEAIALAERAMSGGWTAEQFLARMKNEAAEAEARSRPEPEVPEPQQRGQAPRGTSEPVPFVEAPAPARDDDPPPRPPTTTVATPPRPRRDELAEGAARHLSTLEGGETEPVADGPLDRYRRRFNFRTPDGADVTVVVDEGDEAGAAAVEALALMCHELRAVYGIPKEWRSPG